MNRRNFVGNLGLAAIPFVTGFTPSSANTRTSKASKPVNFIIEGPFYTPEEYLKELTEINSNSSIQGDFYGSGGVVAELEEKFAKLTNKPKALYMPSGTMANELALRVLCGDKTKAIVHADSHIFMDEADAAQSVHNKRLVPIDNGHASYNLTELEGVIKKLSRTEVFYDGLGAISLESPVRRHKGEMIKLSDITELTNYARANNIGSHLDGARLPMAAAYSGTSIKDYASGFDTVYISLYKCFGSAGGAILSGDTDVIDQMPHLIKTHGGTVFRSWTNAAMANQLIDGLEQRLTTMVAQSEALINDLNELSELSIERVSNGTNICFLKAPNLNLTALANRLKTKHGIWVNYPQNDSIQLHFNETLLYQDNQVLVAAMKDAISISR
jgi:threonine aldolase